jgi:flavin-dependent dehydrogenase
LTFQSNETFDAVVVGAGPAGALAARTLAVSGARVLLVEKREFPRWKVCGACLNGHALGVLREAGLGSVTAKLGAVPLAEFDVRSRGRSTRIAMSGGVAVSRARFDQALVDAATEQGVTCLQGVEARVGLPESGSRTVSLRSNREERDVRARVVIVATGLSNRCLEREDRPATHVESGSRVGAGCVIGGEGSIPAELVPHVIFMAVGRGGYVGMVRLEDDSLNVAAAFDPACLRAAGGPGAAAREILDQAGFAPIAGLEQAHWQGTPALSRRTRPLACERLFLVGDAAGYVEPFTGEGMAWGMASGVAVAPLAIAAVERWDDRLVSQWSTTHERAVGRRQGVCRAVAFASRRPWLAHLALGIAATAPGAAQHVVRFLNAPPSKLEMS